MKDYLSDAKNWVSDSPDLSVEQIESAIENLGFKIKQTLNLPSAQERSIRAAIEFLNTELSRMTGNASPAPSAEDPIRGDAVPGELDSSPLVPLGDGPSQELSEPEKRQVLRGLIDTGLIRRGVLRS